MEGGPGIAGMVGPGGGVCWALTALETSSNHLSASEGVRLWPLCIAAETEGGEWSEASGCTQDEVAEKEKARVLECYHTHTHTHTSV